MKEHRHTLKVVLLVGALTLVIAGVAGAIAGKKRTSQRYAPIRKQISVLPSVSSKVSTIEVLNASIEQPDTPAVAAAVEVRNNSNRDITTIMLICGEGGVERSGLTDPDNPHVVLPAHGTITLEMGFGEMTPDCSLMIGGVTYADGSEDGLPETLESMHGIRAQDKAEHDAKKGANKQ